MSHTEFSAVFRWLACGVFLILSAGWTQPLPAQDAKAPVPSGTAPAGADPASFGTLVEKLSPESRKAFGEMLAKDWKNRPEWAEMLIALLKREPINPGVGWFQPGVPKYNWKWLEERFDANKDGGVTENELPKDLPYGEKFFARLDRDGDGELLAADFDYVTQQQQTTPQMLSRFLAAVIDSDSNGRITPEELQNWFKGADKEKSGFLTVDDVNLDFNQALKALSSGGGDDMPGPDKMLAMFFRGELGVWGSGPKLGEDAPDFTLPTHDGKETITLSKLRGKPVILIFGSFT